MIMINTIIINMYHTLFGCFAGFILSYSFLKLIGADFKDGGGKIRFPSSGNIGVFIGTLVGTFVGFGYDIARLIQ